MRRSPFQRFRCLLFVASIFCCALGAHSAHAAPAARMDEKSGAYVSGGFYEGTFSDGTTFQMNLMVAPQLPHGAPPPPKSATLRSAYWETERPRETTVWMEASQQGDEIVAQVPPAAKGSKAQAVNETFVGQTTDDGETFTGVWNRSTGEQRSFSMKRRFSYVTEYHRYVTLDAVAAFGSRPTETVAVHPETGIAAIDDTMPSIVNSAASTPPMGGDDTDTQSIVTVAWASPRMLFLAREDYQYGFGAQHGNGSVTFALYDVRNDRAKELTLNDFLPSADCVQLVSDKVVAALVADHASMPEAGALSTNNHNRVLGSNYLVLPNGIDFYFGQNSMGNATEIHDVFVPKTDLGRCGHALPRYRIVTGPRYLPPTELPGDVPQSRPPVDQLPAGMQ